MQDPAPPRWPFELICNALPHLVYVHDLQLGCTVYINQSRPPASGATADACLAAQALPASTDPLLQRVHPEDRSRVQAWLQRVSKLRDGEQARHEFRFLGVDGGWHWQEAHDTVLRRHPDGRVWQLLGSAVQVDERKRTEANALENRRLLDEMEKAPMAVVEFDLDEERVVRRWAGDAERLFGWSASEVLGRPLRALDLVHPDDLPGVRVMLDALLQHRSSQATWTNRNLDRQRRLLHCTWHNSVMPAAAGSRATVLSLVLDITGHQRAEQALLASEQRHRLLAETPQHGVVHQDAKGRIIAMNPAAERILGKTRERFLGSDSVQEEHDTVREDGNVFPGEDHPTMVALKTGRPVHGVVMGVWNPQLGQRRWLRVDAVPVPAPAAATAGTTATEVYAVFEDITDRQRTERALREADRHKDLFIATLAHELRNPLAPIHNAAVLLRNRHARDLHADGREPDADTLRWAGVIERQVAQMARLLDDLLDVARVASGRMLLKPERLLLASVVEQAVETARPLIEAAGHTLELQLPAEPVALQGDRVRLVQVCANLLTNAAKYTQAGGHIVVAGSCQHDAATGLDYIVIRVRDSGIGLAPEHLHSVFKMFGQVDTTAERSHGGMGIGLALARGLVQMHGGSISAHSAGPGQGSEFVVRLPALRAPTPAAAPAAAAAAAGPQARRVLVVDDNADAAQTLALLLTVDGHSVETAANGLEALARAELWQPDVALLDLGMPRMNGYDLCRALRARPGGSKLLVVAVSGWGQEQDRLRSTEAGFDAHLVKPVRYEQLAALLERAGPE